MGTQCFACCTSCRSSYSRYSWRGHLLNYSWQYESVLIYIRGSIRGAFTTIRFLQTYSSSALWILYFDLVHQIQRFSLLPFSFVNYAQDTFLNNNPVLSVLYVWYKPQSLRTLFRHLEKYYFTRCGELSSIDAYVTHLRARRRDIQANTLHTKRHSYTHLYTVVESIDNTQICNTIIHITHTHAFFPRIE